MLAIRMQRVGRSGHAQFRMIVQDSHQSPKSGKFIALLGSYDPHLKLTTLDKDKALHFLKNGAQPSNRVAGLLKTEGIKLPEWFTPRPKKSGKIRNAEKLRKNQPAKPKAAAESEHETKPTVDDKPQAEVIPANDQPTETQTDIDKDKSEAANKNNTEEPAESNSPESSEPTT